MYEYALLFLKKRWGRWVFGEIDKRIDMYERKYTQVLLVESRCEYVGVCHTILSNFLYIGKFP